MAHSPGGTLTIYIDCVSPYSWFGFTNIRNYRSQLQSHGIEVCIEPFFLGGARNGVGNPYTPPPEAKSAFMQQDLDLTSKLLGLYVVRPKVFPISSLSAVRVARYVKDHYSAEQFEETFLGLVSGYWSKGIDISSTDGIIKALEGVFPVGDLEQIMKGSVEAGNKKRVVDTTMSVGAFGAPWISAINTEDISSSRSTIYASEYRATWPGESKSVEPQQSYNDFELQAGDVLTIRIVADSKTSGSTLLHNHRTGKQAHTSYTNQTTPLCLNSAEWVIESELAFTSFGLDGERTAGYNPFVFEHASYATKDGKKHLAKAEDMFNMIQNGTEVAEAVFEKSGLFKVKDVTPADFAKGE